MKYRSGLGFPGLEVEAVTIRRLGNETQDRFLLIYFFTLLIVKLSIYPLFLFPAEPRHPSMDGYVTCPQKQPRSIAFPVPIILCFMYLHIQVKGAVLFLLRCKVTAASREPQPHQRTLKTVLGFFLQRSTENVSSYWMQLKCIPLNSTLWLIYPNKRTPYPLNTQLRVLKDPLCKDKYLWFLCY